MISYVGVQVCKGKFHFREDWAEEDERWCRCQGDGEMKKLFARVEQSRQKATRQHAPVVPLSILLKA